MRSYSAAVTLALLVGTVACGSSDPGTGGPGATPSQTPIPSSTTPAAPVVAVTGELKRLVFSWPPVSGATTLQLLEDQAGTSDYRTLGDALAGSATGVRVDIVVHEHDWARARYVVEACNAKGCSRSGEVDTEPAMLGSIGYLKGPEAASELKLGTRLALSADGTRLAVGSLTGADAFVFAQDGGEWHQEARLAATGVGPMALDGDGSRLLTGGTWAEPGAAVWLRTGGSWSRESRLSGGTGFGFAVALSRDGRTAAVGEPLNTSGQSGQGAVYVFVRTGSDWSEQTRILSRGNSSWFGGSVSLSADGNTLAIGAADDMTGETSTGAAYVFTRANGVWIEQAFLRASNPDRDDQFGGIVALSGDGRRLAVQAWHEDSAATGVNGNQLDNSASNSGAVYVFSRDTSWSQEAYIKASNTDAGDLFGYGLSLSSDGNILVAGADGEDSLALGIGGDQEDDPASDADAGAAYVFERRNGQWEQTAYVKAPNAERGDDFGVLAVSGDGNVLAIAAPGEDSSATGVGGDQTNNAAPDSGAIYLY